MGDGPVRATRAAAEVRPFRRVARRAPFGSPRPVTAPGPPAPLRAWFIATSTAAGIPRRFC